MYYINGHRYTPRRPYTVASTEDDARRRAPYSAADDGEDEDRDAETVTPRLGLTARGWNVSVAPCPSHDVFGSQNSIHTDKPNLIFILLSSSRFGARVLQLTDIVWNNFTMQIVPIACKGTHRNMKRGHSKKSMIPQHTLFFFSTSDKTINQYYIIWIVGIGRYITKL